MQQLLGVEPFFAKYPPISDDDLFNFYNGENFNKILFNQDIFRKKEFYDLKLSETQPDKPEDNLVYNHQKLISRFLSSHTLYDELLLFHSPGTGKTMSAIHTIENALKNNFRRAIVIVPNDTLVDRFKKEIIFLGSQGKYIPEEEEDDKYLSEEQLREKQFMRGKRNLQPFYRITTHERLYNTLLKLPENKIKSDFSDSIIVVDEAHRIANNTTWYSTYYNLFHMLTNRKILLMTGTPMKNEASEIAPLLNLILPRELALPTGKAFEERFFDSYGRCIDEDFISDRLLGRVSYLKLKSSIPYTFKGGYVSDITYPLYKSQMSVLQTETYNSVRLDDSEESFYRNSLQASLFAFPDGSYGMEGYKKYVESGDFLNINLRGNTEEKLAKLKEYSCKYAQVIESIVKNPKKNTFVYTYSIKGGGAILFGKCLQMFGYSKINRKEDVRGPGKRYAVLSDAMGTNVKSVLDIFNSYENRFGDYIQVLIGGKQVEEGVTFYSIQRIHVLTPTWNFSSLDQAIARGIRMNAHRYLQPNTPVQIYLHVAIPRGRGDSIDTKIYEFCQKKDVPIKQIEYLCKTVSWDCAITYERNLVRNGKDRSRECEYNDCLYRCKGVVYPYVLEEESLDKSSYQLYYQDYYQEKLVELLSSIFKKQFIITLWEIMDLVDKRYTIFQVFQALQQIVRKSIVFINKYGFRSYMQEHNNMYFLTNSIYDDTFLSSYYTDNPILSSDWDFITYLDHLFQSDENMNRRISILTNLPYEQKIKNIPLLPPIAQESFIENSILAREQNKRTYVSDWVNNFYAKYITQFQNKPSSKFLGDSIFRVLMDSRQGVWKTLLIQQNKEQRMMELIYTETGIYGMIKNDKFIIVNLSDIPKERRLKENNTRGKVCLSHRISELLEIIQLLGLPEPPSRVKANLCQYILKHFEDNNMIL